MTMYHFGLIGHPVGHSLSKEWMELRFMQIGICADYTPVDLPDISDFPALLAERRWDGFNVTIPYKRAIIPYLDTLTPTAAAIGAVNTIIITSDRHLTGDNTDVKGFRATLVPHLQEGTVYQALVLGTGGASHAVEYVLKSLGIKPVFVSRQSGILAGTPSDAQSAGRETIGYEMLTDEIISSHKLIINTTPLGMYPNTGSMPDIPYNALTDGHILYDLVYNPQDTEFLKQGALRGAKCIAGLGMLHSQADASLEIWLHDKLL
ncbi:MAG: shikimate dehydrogenase family protein [Candidatus Aphodosoma sp.]